MPKLLLVEDDHDTRRALGAYLAARGYEVTTANDGVEALVAMERSRPELILLDALLPRMDGFGFLDRLRRGAGEDTPVVMMSAVYTDETVRTRAFADYGVLDYLVKPVKLTTVEQRVRAILEETNHRGSGAGEPFVPQRRVWTRSPKKLAPAGTLRGYRLADLLEQFALEEGSGVLHLECKEDTQRVLINRGRPVWMLPRREAAEIFRQRIVAAFGWHQGRYRLELRPDLPEPSTTVVLDPRRVIIDGLRKHYILERDNPEYPVDADMVGVRLDRPAWRRKTLPLRLEERKALEALEAGARFGDLERAAGLPTGQGAAVLRALFTLGMIGVSAPPDPNQEAPVADGVSAEQLSRLAWEHYKTNPAAHGPGAARDLRDARLLEPRSPWPHYYRGLIAEAEGRLDVATAHFKAALQSDPEHDPSRDCLEHVMWVSRPARG